MFQGFSEKTGVFLWELAFHNERPWFLTHKQEFEDEVNTPFKALAADTYDIFSARFPDFEGRVHVSRIYRDARRLFGRGPYKDHLWFTVRNGSSRNGEGPAFWFEIHPATCSYGLGFFDVTPALMEQYRRAIDANPARFERLAEQVARMPGFRVIGPEYARRKGDYPEPVRSWYSRKWVAAERSLALAGEAFSPSLPQLLWESFEKLMPMFEFLAGVDRA